MRIHAPVSTIVAILIGLIVLSGYFIPVAALQSLRLTLVQWAVILAAFALLIGIVNLVVVHLDKIRTRQPGSLFSLVLLVAFLITLVIAVIFGPTSPWGLWIFNYIQVPIESSLLAILTVILILGVIRLFRRRIDTFSVVFVVAALLVLLVTAPLFVVGDIPGLNLVRTVLVQVLSVAGARGILLGVALGVIATGTRILLGADRPYGG